MEQTQRERRESLQFNLEMAQGLKEFEKFKAWERRRILEETILNQAIKHEEKRIAGLVELPHAL